MPTFVLTDAHGMTDSAVFDKLSCERTTRSRSTDAIAAYRAMNTAGRAHCNYSEDKPAGGEDDRPTNSMTSDVQKRATAIEHDLTSTTRPMFQQDAILALHRPIARSGIARPPSSAPPGPRDRAAPERKAIASHKSCPDFSNGHKSSKLQFQPAGSPGEQRLARDKLSGSKTRVLTVPDIFITSYTHSDSAIVQPNANGIEPEGHQKERPLRKQRYSEPDLAHTALKDQLITKRPLKKSLSDYQSGSKGHSNEPKLIKLTDYLYIGNLEAMHHQQMLCRSKIASIIDLTNVDPADMSQQQMNEIPCSCSSATRHCPVTLRIRVRESDLVDIKAHFAAINKFIEGARQKDKHVMICCEKGNSLSVLAAIQYLMTCRDHSYSSALDIALQADASLMLNAAYNELLRSIDRLLLASGKTQRKTVKVRVDRARSLGSTGRREAWSAR